MNYWLKRNIRKYILRNLEHTDKFYDVTRGGHPIELDELQLDYCIDMAIRKASHPSLVKQGAYRRAHLSLCQIRGGHFKETNLQQDRRAKAAKEWDGWLWCNKILFRKTTSNEKHMD